MIKKFLLGLALLVLGGVAHGQKKGSLQRERLPYESLPDVMPGTKTLSPEEDRSIKILDEAHVFIEEKIAAAPDSRAQLWHRDLASNDAYERSIEPNRGHFMELLGIEDAHHSPESFKRTLKEQAPPVAMERIAVNDDPEIIAETSLYRVYQVRWPVLNRVNGEGLLLEPKTKPVANVVAIPDADQTPEQLAGLSPGIDPESQFARHLAENGFEVLVPVLVNRDLLFPGTPQQQTHREWIYRQAFHMGRHIIGYEVQKVLAAIDWFKKTFGDDAKVGVAGYNEGALLAFYSAAIDQRIDAALVSGYFNTRQNVWDEPIYRNVWNLLTEFGDAEIATLIAPRALVIEHSAIPEIKEQMLHPEKDENVSGWPYTGYKGTLKTPDYESVAHECQRIATLLPPGFQPVKLIAAADHSPVPFGSVKALQEFSSFLGQQRSFTASRETPTDRRKGFDAAGRQLRQVQELEDHVQWLLRDSDYHRDRFFLYQIMPEFEHRTWSVKAHHPTYAPERFTEKSGAYRKIFREQILGVFPDAMLPVEAETRKLYDNDRWTGYEVQIPVYDHLHAAGVLLIPKNLAAGERRPVVVCQHGRDDIPQKLVEGNYPAYNNTAGKLADEGFVVYAPYNPYRGEDKYRWLARKANTVGKTLFSFIVAQHDQTLRWLGSLSFVDKGRIAFYGLSYGGETAMRVPAALEGYCLSICSGDFGDWSRKVVDTHFSNGYMNTMEWEMPYFNMGSTFSYAEMAYLIFPRPFMVERGHDDLVQPTSWVAYEYGKVRYLYDMFGLTDRTAIEFFPGGHSMLGNKTFEFLHQHLHWPPSSRK